LFEYSFMALHEYQQDEHAPDAILHGLRRHLPRDRHLKRIRPEDLLERPDEFPQLSYNPEEVAGGASDNPVSLNPIILDPKKIPRNVDNLMPIAPPIGFRGSSLAAQPHIGVEDSRIYTPLVRLQNRPEEGIYPYAYRDLGEREVLAFMRNLGMLDDSAWDALNAGFAQGLMLIGDERSQVQALFSALNALYMDPMVTNAHVGRTDGGFRWSIRSKEGDEVCFERGPSAVEVSFERDPPVVVQMPEQGLRTVVVVDRRGNRKTFYGVKSRVLEGRVDPEDEHSMQVLDAIGSVSGGRGRWWTE
jgi:hypothetical protein